MKLPLRRARLLPLLLIAFCLPFTAAGAQKPGAAGNRVRLLRSWEEVAKVGEKSVNRHVDLVFDYTEGMARQLTYDEAGRLVSVTTYVENAPQPSPEEIAEAIETIRSDRELARIFARTRAVPEGGFLLEEAPGGVCGPRTRCVQIQWLSEDRIGLIRWVVVDLVKGAIVYRAYIPQGTAVSK